MRQSTPFSMMWVCKRHAFCMLLLLFVLGGCFYGDGVTSISGTVLDESSVPVSQATMTLTPTTESLQGTRDQKAFTRVDGIFRIDFSHAPVAGQFELRVTKEGFVPISKTIESGDCTANNMLTLKRVKSPVR